MSKQRTHGMIRRLLSGLLCLALVLGLLPAGLVQPAQAAHWADAYGQRLVEWGVMRGDVTGGDLRLDRPITRAELVAMLNRAYGYSRKAGSPFEDVSSAKWYADDIDIAYNAGYFLGTSTTPPLASPESNVTREQAAVFLARNLMLQETVGETLGFSDSRTLSEWSRGLIGAAVKEGVLTGYTDGSFRPGNNITRGEVAAMLVRAIGTPVNQSGDQSLGNVYGNVTVNTSGVNLRNTTIVGNLYITGGIDLGHVLLENVTVLGQIIISGAGEAISGQESVVLRNVVADELVIDSLRSPFVTVKVQGVTDIPLVSVRTNAYLDDSSWDGYGLTRIELNADPGAKLQLAGSVKEVVNLTPASDLQLVKGSAEKITVDEYATASKLLVGTGTQADEVNLDVGTEVTGDGDIKVLNVGSNGSTVEQLPDKIVIRPGIIADIDGEPMDSNEADELSAEPRILAGYPRMQNISPTQAEGVFSGSKPGTIYWAISAVADGSVSEEDLISNPTYGGNIFEEQAGSIDATRANTEYLEQVEKLEPDGSYYVTTILVDGRGKRSPIKVAAFSTPDDTKPAFVKDPTMTKITTDVAQTTVMANKDCLLYWALLPEGAKAPTPQEFRTGSVGGNYGYGSLSVVKNAEISINVNRQKLREKQSYDLFLWLTDHNGAQSMDAPFKITFTTPDETAPVVTDPQQIPPYAADTATVTFSMNEAPATLYWAVVAEGDNTFIASGTDMSDLRTKIRVESAGDSAISSGSAAVNGAYADTVFQITKLVTETTGTNNYTMYYVGKDAAGNYSDQVKSITIKTLDTKPPEVSLTFSDEVDGSPRANSDVRLEFSETVKGGNQEGSKTFLDFYQDVLEADAATRPSAKNDLSDELRQHIVMHSVPRNGQPVPVKVRENGQDDDDWVIDFHNAIVEMNNGKMVITLPSDRDNPSENALQMDSGATYYFQLLGVYDNAFIPNGILDPDTGKSDLNGNLKLPKTNFTTIYGQVELARNTSETKISQKNSDGTDIPGADQTLHGIRLDMCVDVKPESTDKMPKTEYWDMIIWSDTGVDVQIYFQKDGGAWELLNPNADISIETGGVIGLGSRPEVPSTSSHRIQAVKGSLVEGHTYRYGVHITRVGNIGESSNTAEPQDWSELVTMKFSLVAGTQGDIQNLSGSPALNYDKFVNVDKTATEIGIEYMQTGTRRILEYPKQFTDTRVPAFSSGMPTFDAGSGTINMKLGLERPGKVYWVAAPMNKTVGEVITNVKDGVPVNSRNDGSTPEKIKDKDGNEVPNPDYIDPAKNKTYIPTSGSDRVANAAMIHFMTGTDPNPKKGAPAAYSAPYYRDIYNGSTAYARFPNIKTGVAEVGGAVEKIEITGLMPEQWYYIYIVRQGGGDPNRIVEIYRVQTTKVKVPEVVVTGTSTTATMTPSEDCILSFALVEYNSLPSFIRDATGSNDSVLKQMMERQSGTTGPSKFDKTTDNDLKKRVAEYILGSSEGTGTAPVATWTLPKDGGEDYKDLDAIPAKRSVTWDFEKYMTSPNSEYVVLVIGRHQYGGTGGSDYGFGAVRALYTPDKIPPEFTGKGSKYLAASITTCSKPDKWEDGTWTKNPFSYTYTGTVSIRFSKDIYFHDSSNNTRYAVYYEANPSPPTTPGEPQRKGLLSLLGGGAQANGHLSVGSRTGSVGNTVTLNLEDIAANEEIVLFGSGKISNRSDYTTDYILTLRFDPTLTEKDYDSTKFTDRGMPGFVIEWKEVKN